ncbi:hypothetical protein ACO0SA_002585 [Hanseniaspora valbyensis]
MSSDFDSSDEEDELLLAYVDSYRQQLAEREKQQQQKIKQEVENRNTFKTINETQETTTLTQRSDDIKADLHIANGQIAVLKEKYDKAELSNKESREQFLKEKQQITNKFIQELNNLKNEINNLNDEKSFLKQKLKQSSRQFDNSIYNSSNTSIDTQENKDKNNKSDVTSDSVLQLLTNKNKHNKSDTSDIVKIEVIKQEDVETGNIKKEETLDNDDVDVDEEPVRIKPKLNIKQKQKTKSIFNFKTTLKFNDNYNLMTHLTKYQIPGMPDTVLHYLDTKSTSGNDYFKTNKLGSDFLSFGNDLVITESLSKFIELLLDFCLTRINDILRMSYEEDNKYIPFLLALIYQIINYRASACDVSFLKNLFMVLFNKLIDFEHIFKLKSIYDPKLTMLLPKYEVVIFESQNGFSKKWADLGTETSLINDENIFLKQNTSLLSTSYNNGSGLFNDEFEDYGNLNTRFKKNKYKNKKRQQQEGQDQNDFEKEDETPEDYFYEVPNFNTEFLDFLIVVYTFDILETIVSNIDFLISDVKDDIYEEEEEHVIMENDDFNEMVDNYISLFKLSFTNSFQPIIQPLFSNVKMFASLFSISCKLKLDLNKFIDLISVQCDWLLKINLKNYLHKLPIRYHIVSLNRYINGGENIQYNNLITPLIKIMNNEINYTPDHNKFIIIHKSCELLSSNILKNMETFLDKWFSSYTSSDNNTISINLDDAESSVIARLLKSCTTLMTTNFLACQGNKSKKNLDLKRANTIQCIKILQLFQMNMDTFAEVDNKELQKIDQDIDSNTPLKNDDQGMLSSSQFSNDKKRNITKINTSSDAIKDNIRYVNEKLSQLFIKDESWKKELVVFSSRIIFQDQKHLLLKHELLKDFLRDLLDSLVTFDETEAIYDALII